MDALSLKIPNELKTKAMRLARKKNMSFNSLVNYWLQVAILQDETIEWMKSRMKGKNPELLIKQFGQFLDKSRPGNEPSLEVIKEAMNNK